MAGFAGRPTAALSVLFTEPETEEEKKRKEERDDVYVWDHNYKFRRLWVIDPANQESGVAGKPARAGVLLVC